jgi:hypothetical protein
MSRSPVYAKNNDAYRIVYVANGLWRTQMHDNFKGTKTSDPWGNISPAMSREDAIANLARFNRETKAA